VWLSCGCCDTISSCKFRSRLFCRILVLKNKENGSDFRILISWIWRQFNFTFLTALFCVDDHLFEIFSATCFCICFTINVFLPKRLYDIRVVCSSLADAWGLILHLQNQSHMAKINVYTKKREYECSTWWICWCTIHLFCYLNESSNIKYIWTLSTWVHRCFFSAMNEFLHISSKNGYYRLWVCKCLLKVSSSLNEFLHISYENGCSPLCVCRYIVNLHWCVNDLLHMLQEYGHSDYACTDVPLDCFATWMIYYKSHRNMESHN
jgi:hypothetical protein